MAKESNQSSGRHPEHNPDRQTHDNKNQGEGNREAARRYNKKAKEFAQSGRVEDKAHEAARARESEERYALDQAEKQGKAPKRS